MSLTSRIASTMINPLLAIAAGVAVSLVVFAIAGIPPLGGLKTLLFSFGVYPEIVFVRASVLILTGLAFAIPLRVGLFNIGAEGILYAGAITSLVVALTLGGIAVPMAASVIVGITVGLIVGILKEKAGINEVVSTIMINWIIYWSSLYIVTALLADPTYPQLTREIPSSSRIGSVELAGYSVPLILLISLATSIAIWMVMYYTYLGLSFRVAGSSEKAAVSRGVNVSRVRIASLAVAGGLSGLAGSLLLLGHAGAIDTLLSTLRGYGFEGIGVALVGGNHPLGVIAAGLFFADLVAGSETIQRIYDIPPEMADLVTGAMIVAIAAVRSMGYIISVIRVRMGWM
ncbi:MAG: ABC transporter permease [Aeropyrum sp.]|nr:ABC transporter permease [Aeropyrum sp.]MCE4616352.1 ABC transporter permease [Aeropyrum sp.]